MICGKTISAIDARARETAWLASHYGTVFAALRESLDSPLAALAPGTGGRIDAALAFFRRSGDASAVRRLEAIALSAHELHLALRMAANETIAQRRAELSLMAIDWLHAAPMLPSEIMYDGRQAA